MNKNVLCTLAVTLLVCLTFSSVADALCYRHCYLRCRYCYSWYQGRWYCCGVYVYCHYHCSGKRSIDVVERQEHNEKKDEVPCSSLVHVADECYKGDECLNLAQVAKCLGDDNPDKDDLRVAFQQADVSEKCGCLDKDEFPNLCYHGQDGKHDSSEHVEDQCPP